MGKYCCLVCPTEDFSEKSLDDSCPNCGRKYRFPLSNPPKEIRDYRIVKPLGRGFYGVTYVAERGLLGAKSVLKVSPKEIYASFPNKDFDNECRKHQEVAIGTQHIVDIRDMFDADVTFGEIELPCHVAELEYIDGKPLADYLEAKTDLTATTAAQIAIDLFKIHEELRRKGVNHNDLHADNIIIERLSPDVRRAEAIDTLIRAVAIDLGSVSDGSKSQKELRLGDLHWMAAHLDSMVRILLHDPDKLSDHDNRVASALQIIAQRLLPDVENQRTPEPADFIGQIEETYYRVSQPWQPWSEPLILKAFNASYNAQTMKSWHVPRLLVDPEEQWVNGISSPGPQVITGMRGCGKTMLLRALQFHARAAKWEAEGPHEILDRITTDNYVGLFVSAQRLLDRLGENSQVTPDQFARLFVAYGHEAVRALHHLRDLDETKVSELAHRELAEAITRCISNANDLMSSISLHDLERRLSFLLTSLSQSEFQCSLQENPGVAFPFLADAIRRCSAIWCNAQVMFLLDDVSTRYLHPTRIEKLLSALLFQNPSCAFKVTSEAQTIELGLKSPGQVHSARVGRDLSVFDLGARVYEKIKKSGEGNGRDFVEKILKQRAKYYTPHPQAAPREVLGDVSLETIAAEIGESPKNSRKRKLIYRGITALAHMCVGDIGDVISLYEQILKSGAGQAFPIPSEIQSECFQDFCSRRLYDLNRRAGILMDAAKSFAEASHDLLVQSINGRQGGTGKRRIRQYSSIYVRITTGDLEEQTDRLRDLIDAGVFVFAGGSSVPRAKTRDSNPIQQFKLTYRKIYGLVNFIGLADRDRYELSGKDLEEWLAKPSEGKEILLRNLAKGESKGDPLEEAEWLAVDVKQDIEDGKAHSATNHEPGYGQFSLFKGEEESPDRPEDAIFLDRKQPIIQRSERTFPKDVIDCAILGLGFEERALESARRLCAMVKPQNAIAVEYREPGRGAEIMSILSASEVHCSTIRYDEIVEHGMEELENGNVIVDITGLAKPVIFHAIRNQLRHKRSVWVCHTEAVSYYPLEDDVEKVFRADELDHYAQLENLSNVLKGETGPYKSFKLLESDSDDTRQRILCAFSSPKHERLLSLLDSRDYDRVEIISPKNDSNRSKVAKLAAEIAARNSANSNVTEIDSNEIDNVLKFITGRYKWWYVDHGANFEFGLTGSKLQAVACAAASAAYKISQCWYLQPAQFDHERFTQGVGKTHFYEITLKDS